MPGRDPGSARGPREGKATAERAAATVGVLPEAFPAGISRGASSARGCPEGAGWAWEGRRGSPEGILPRWCLRALALCHERQVPMCQCRYAPPSSWKVAPGTHMTCTSPACLLAWKALGRLQAMICPTASTRLSVTALLMSSVGLADDCCCCRSLTRPQTAHVPT